VPPGPEQAALSPEFTELSAGEMWVRVEPETVTGRRITW
jgi:hypothetical protein